MLFASYEFLGFLILVLLIYYLLPGKFQWPFLLFASYVFYFLSDPRYLIYIFITSLTTFWAAKKLQQRKDAFKALPREERKPLKDAENKKQKHLFLACLLFNLGILAVIKYTNFTISNINSLLHTFGSTTELSFVNIIIPMGISFYTFMAMGYLIDVKRGTVKAETNFFKFALFISFFPQLVQGPISRFSDLSKTLFEPHKANYEVITRGLQRILWGYFKKLVVADRIVVGVNTIIHDPDTYHGGFVFVGMMFYAFELYCDFTGGIDITIGIAEAMGISVTENFIRPYFSKNIKEYWNRWHITMGSWFTDYIFYPLSISQPMLKLSKFSRAHLGKQIGKRVPVYLASFIVWFTTGIWHGASWNFIVWGIGNFVVIMISQELEPFYRWFHSKFKVDGTFFWRLFQVLRTVFIMSFLRTFDCYRDVPLTFKMYKSLFTELDFSQLSASAFLGIGLNSFDYCILFISLILLITVSLIARSGSVRDKIKALPAASKYIIWFGLFVIIIIFGTYGIGYESSQFIYNQF